MKVSLSNFNTGIVRELKCSCMHGYKRQSKRKISSEVSEIDQRSSLSDNKGFPYACKPCRSTTCSCTAWYSTSNVMRGAVLLYQ